MRVAVERERQRQNRLEEHLLLGREAPVLAASDLGHVVGKADAQVAKAHQQHGQRHVLVDRHAVIGHDQRSENRRARDHQAAHRRGALLLLVALRRQLVDVLPELQLVEHRQQQLAQHDADRERDQQGNHHPLHDPSSVWGVSPGASPRAARSRRAFHQTDA